MKKTYLISTKLQYSIKIGIKKLLSREFTESDIKLLLLDLREVTNYLVKRLKPTEYDMNHEMLTHFLDVCDFIAHPHKNKGPVVDAIEQFCKVINANEEVDDRQFATFINDIHNNLISADNILAVMMGTALLASQHIQLLDQSEVLELSSKISDVYSDFTLCLFSILQGSIISFPKQQENKDYGILQITPYHGYYFLMCRVFPSRLEPLEDENSTGTFVPVIRSSVRCLDEKFHSYDHQYFPNKLFEPYRDVNGNLNLKLIEIDNN